MVLMRRIQAITITTTTITMKRERGKKEESVQRNNQNS
jgi:hypothetical protein